MNRIAGKDLPLRSHTERVLSDYFSNLNGHRPARLYNLVLREVEEPLLRAVLDYADGNQSQAAEILGITRTTHDLLDLKHICKLHGEILVAGTVTLAWLVEERKSFRTHYDVDVDWKMALVAAKTCVLPVP
jgi:Fis family transcriptional regulator